MKNQKDTATAKTVYGKELETPLTFDFEWTEYETIDEVRAAKDELSDADVVKVRNAERKANARSKAQTAAATALGIQKPTIENDEQLRLRTVFKSLMANGKMDEATAKATASSILDIAWVD